MAASDTDDAGTSYADIPDEAAGLRRIAISCENIQKTYLLGTEGVPALRGVGLDVYDGEFCVIYGNSGGGKTTLLNILGTIDTPTKGNLSMFGVRIHPKTPDHVMADLRLHKLGFVFQTFNLLPTMTAAENVQVPMVLSGTLSKEQQDARVKQLLESVGMGERMKHYPSMLSGGEQQRVTIARAMANNPKVLLLDEPTGDLDTKNTKNVINILTQLNQEQGVTILMVTHDPEMKWYANRAVYVQDGKIGRIDVIPKADNNASIAQLHKDLQTLQHSRTGVESAMGLAREGGGGNGGVVSTTSPSAPPPPPSESGASSQAPHQPSAPLLCEFRDPEDYATYSETSLCAPRGLGDALFSSIFGGRDERSQAGNSLVSTARMSQVGIDMQSSAGWSDPRSPARGPDEPQEMMPIGDNPNST